MTQPPKLDTLAQSLDHLEYEMAMMVATARMLAKHPQIPELNTARPPGYYWANDWAVTYLAAMESALTHARLLDDFFSHGAKPTSAKPDDRFAFEYCGPSRWQGRALMSAAQRKAINKQLSHFTAQREPRLSHPLGQFAHNAVKALVALTYRADTQWQPRLQDILEKTLAEQTRSNERWTPVDPRLHCILRAIQRRLPI